jgi:hypothetical protein
MPRPLRRLARHVPVLLALAVAAVTTGGGFPH